ncbi:RNA-binding protein 1-like [Benincasa hispida]|uniref:RNA-binding protein 1-like n=1 Tax=Benincasa hispida TaxID=102211 RepID=UPI0018FFE21D|nr:RNA-binding protein 1-like [Benincasa hispida]
MIMSTTRMENNNDQCRGRKIFVGGLSAELTEDEFKNYFEKFGKITDVVVMHDSVTNRPRGFGFITFESVESVDSVLQSNFHELNGRRVEVKRAIPKKGNYNGGHIPNARTQGGKSPLPNSNRNVPFPYPYYGSSYPVYPGFTPFPHYGGPGVDLYGSHLYGNWFPPSFGNMASEGTWYGPNFFGVGIFPPPYRNSLIPPIYSSKGLSDTGTGNGMVDTRRNGEIKQNTTGKRIMSADAVPFQIKDRT